MVGVLGPLLAGAAALAAFYAATSESDSKAILGATATLVLLALCFLDLGYLVVSVIQLSLAAGFLAAASFLAPELGGRARGVAPGLGALGSLAVLMVFSLAHLSVSRSVSLEAWASAAVALASAPLAAALLSLRLVVREEREGID